MPMKASTTERRSVFRVHVPGALLDVVIDGVSGSALLDVNSEGFAVAVKSPPPTGRRVLVTFTFQDVSYSGYAEVRNAFHLPSGRYRCGLRTCEDEQQLRRGLREVAVALQREQLRRRAERR